MLTFLCYFNTIIKEVVRVMAWWTRNNQ